MKHLVFVVSFAVGLFRVVPGFAQEPLSREEVVSAHCQRASSILVQRAMPKSVDQSVIDIQVLSLEPVDLLWKTFSTIEVIYKCYFRIFVKNDRSGGDSDLLGSAEMDILLFRDRQEAQNETHTNLVPVSEIRFPNGQKLYTALRKLNML